ncbi:uncharacterized protein [Rutidosis leptorrhynchoides]|uniref:uncharacterized protein n=1 Tax=Rutidosis leptorrhynchoides TaxID=125765 RepID=UPI003A98F080
MYLVWTLFAHRYEYLHADQFDSDSESDDADVESPKKMGYVTIPPAESCNLGSSSSPLDDDSKPVIRGDWRELRARLVAAERISRPESTLSSSPTIILGEKWAHAIHHPERGCLLIATEKLDGVHIFERTVVLLLSTGPMGPNGIILNRPSLMSIKEMKSTAKLDVSGTFSDRPLFFGGPLEEAVFLLNPKGSDNGVEGSGVFDPVMKGLHYGTKESVGCAAEMVKRNVVEVGDFKFFDGYCGWEKGQLDEEIRNGYWSLAACSPSVVGMATVGCVRLWEEVTFLLGSKKVW